MIPPENDIGFHKSIIRARAEEFQTAYEQRFNALRAETHFIGPICTKVLTVEQAHRMALEYAKAAAGTEEDLSQ